MFRELCAATAILALTLGGCAGSDGPNKQDTGLIVGAVAGGIIGNQFGRGRGRAVATIAGAAIGGLVGSSIGRSLDQQDRMLAQQAELAALEGGPSGQPTPWRNPDNGRYGQVVPQPPFQRNGMNCREYMHTVYIDGRPQTMRGTACRNPDGTWQNVG